MLTRSGGRSLEMTSSSRMVRALNLLFFETYQPAIQGGHSEVMFYQKWINIGEFFKDGLIVLQNGENNRFCNLL